jgi:fatty acid synthase subunit alpha
VVHPRYLLAALEPMYYLHYGEKNQRRASQAYKAMSEMMIKNSLVKIKDGPPYAPGLERQVLLNSMARATLNGKTGSYEFTKLSNSAVLDVSNGKAVTDMISDKAYSASDAVGVGVDHGKSDIRTLRTASQIPPELISAVPSHNPTFVERNFTDAEIAYCRAQPSSQSSFAARWAGKEAVFKSLGVKSQGAGAAMKDIEILNDEATGAPVVHLHGEAKNQAVAKGISRVLISLSHSEVSFMKLNK